MPAKRKSSGASGAASDKKAKTSSAKDEKSSGAARGRLFFSCHQNLLSCRLLMTEYHEASVAEEQEDSNAIADPFVALKTVLPVDFALVMGYAYRFHPSTIETARCAPAADFGLSSETVCLLSLIFSVVFWKSHLLVDCAL